MIKEIDFKMCRNSCPDVVFKCHTTEELTLLKEVIGQERAVEAIQFGLEIDSKGFNLYLAGMPGTGRKTAITYYGAKNAKNRRVPDDWCYVNNFKEPNKPHAIRLEKGSGQILKNEMDFFASHFKETLEEAFGSEDYEKKKTETLKRFDVEKQNLSTELNKATTKEGFTFHKSTIGTVLTPVIDGKSLSEKEFAELPREKQKKLQEKKTRLEEDIRAIVKRNRDLDIQMSAAVKVLEMEVASFVLEPLLSKIADSLGQKDVVVAYLKDVRDDVVENLRALLSEEPKQQPIIPSLSAPKENLLDRYKVNLLVDNSKLDQAPVVMELNPTYQHLFGYIEKETYLSVSTTNYLMINSGAVHKSNGGLLILPIKGVLSNPTVYDSLKRMITNERIEIEEPASLLGIAATKSLMPEPIPFDAKVILIGSPQIYDTLYGLDAEFKDIFKVKADFDSSMERDNENVMQYAAFICTLCTKEGLRHLEPSAIAAIVDYSSRLVEDQNKLSTQFARVADILREADFYSRKEGADIISRKHVDRAFEAKVYRSNLIQEKINEFITKNVYKIDISGSKVGQINGLAVLESGDYSFGKPSRITASVGVGMKGILDIEREAQMSGPTHTKGVMILGGYLNATFAHKKPLSLNARLAFEQSYSGVDGDSASSTELYAILSTLSNLPIKQNFAVTGSVNQKGEVQAIGGVNEKIEGFYAVCKTKGLTGEQSCMIPSSNVQNLTLKDEVVDAIKAGKFHIYPVKTIAEGIEVLTGVPAGELQIDGSYPKDTVNYLVQERLDEMAELAKEYRE